MNLSTVIVIIIIAAVCTICGWIAMLIFFGWKLALCIFLVLFGNEMRKLGTQHLRPLWIEHQKAVRDE